jgi:hypothetical protein
MGKNMAISEPNKSTQIASTRAAFADYQLDLPSIVKQIRLCRSTLGAVLEELDGGDRSAISCEEIGDSSMGVAAEIERLWECIKRSH